MLLATIKMLLVFLLQKHNENFAIIYEHIYIIYIYIYIYINFLDFIICCCNLRFSRKEITSVLDKEVCLYNLFLSKATISLLHMFITYTHHYSFLYFRGLIFSSKMLTREKNNRLNKPNNMVQEKD